MKYKKDNCPYTAPSPPTHRRERDGVLYLLWYKGRSLANGRPHFVHLDDTLITCPVLIYLKNKMNI